MIQIQIQIQILILILILILMVLIAGPDARCPIADALWWMLGACVGA
ncbi:hypothetical protein [Thalassospira povalilytica]|nr:hypothetical protein [Thalassospira povalilytica]